ncbi:MAG: FG-GAP repeat protein [Deinococcota bacterium]
MSHTNYLAVKSDVASTKLIKLLNVVLVVLIALSATALAQNNKLTASDADADDNFGYSLAISGRTVLVGAWQNDSLRANSGAAYVFEFTADNTWQPTVKLMPDNADFAGDEFGKAVDIDGDYLVVGAQFDDTVDNDRGAVYVFARTNDVERPWQQVVKLTASDSAFRDFFGRTVAISGNHIVVGAPEDDDMGNQSGSAYVFELNTTNSTWQQVAKLTAADGDANDNFGTSVAIDADTVVVGADEHNHNDINNNGAAYVFERDPGTGSWSQTAKLTASDGDAQDEFGTSLTINGNRLLVGAPFDDDPDNAGGSVYVFDRTDGTISWTQTAKLTATDASLGNQFGYAVAFTGNTALIGAPEEDTNGNASGAVYVLQQDVSSGVWSQVDKIIANDSAAFDTFGYAVAVSEGVALIGSPEDDDQGEDESGSAYLLSLDILD